MLIKKCSTFSKEEPGPDDIVIPVTAKFRTKIRADGMIDKLKTRVCLRGDQQGELTDWETWCPIGSFKELRPFTAMAAHIKARIY